MRRSLAAFLVLLFLFAPSFSQAEDKALPGPYPVEILTEDWRDASRDRIVPVKIYYPKAVTGLCPTILFSHGLGGTREAGQAWGEHWASYGYVSIHLQHPGSDRTVIQGIATAVRDLRRAMLNPQTSMDRIADVKFVLDFIENLPPTHALSGKIDLNKIGISGHSFGAFTALSRVGMRFLWEGKEIQPLDPRLKASLPMSAPPKIGKTSPEVSFGDIRIPVMLMTGTEDDSPINSTKAADRPIPFLNMPAGGKYLITFEGGDHMVFSPVQRLGHPQDKTIIRLVKIMSLAFWDAYLKGDQQAEKWLKESGARETLGKDASYQRK